jgi:hypothetical protein
MTPHLDILLAAPTVFFTVPLVFVVLYWVMAIAGAVDLEIFDAVDGALDGAVDGALDGAVDGAFDGAVDGAADGALDADVELEVDGDADVDIGGGGIVGAFAAILRLGRVPATIPLSLFVVWGWAISFSLMELARAWALPEVFAVGLIVFAIAVVFGLLFANLTVRPIEPLFHFEPGRRRHTLVGEACTITTGRVDAGFGQADAIVGGDHLLVQVRCLLPNALCKGARALIVSWDDDRDAFIVEPMAAAGLLEDRRL